MDKIIYNVSSHNRKDTLLKTIESIYNQSDLINIVLNNYDEIPEDLLDNKINIFLANNEKGDAYKFLNLENTEGYYFSIDDDLIYPENYSNFMVEKVEQYGRKSIITLHGRSFDKFPIDEFYSKYDSKILHFRHKLNNDVTVQFGGTGVMCFHTDLMKLPISYFSYPNMADVWIGKYAIENDLDVVCAAHPSNFVIQQKFQSSIYDESQKSDEIQTKIVNQIFSEKKISVVIPTFNNVKYLDECLESVIKSMGNIEGEVLVGIDSCQDTLTYVKNNSYDIRIKFFYFEKNIGPYIIRNTLSKMAKSNLILFFDSDDIMDGGLINELLRDYDHYDFCRIQMLNFNHGEDFSKIPRKGKTKFGEGVFAIKKSVFLYMNGFEPWRCAADSDFMSRLYKNNYTFKTTNDISMYRRIHPTSITMNSDTSYYSKTRKRYVDLMNSKTYFGPLESLTIEPYQQVLTSIFFPNEKQPPKLVDPELPTIKTQAEILLSFLENKKQSPNTSFQSLQKKREMINSYNRFTPPKRKK